MDTVVRQRIRDVNAGGDIADMRLRVVDYARVSTVKPEQQSSFQNQLETYREIIQSNPNWHYEGTYSDEGKTGSKISVRGGFQQMVADAKAGRFDLILVKSISRFARNLKESLMVKDELKAAGVMVYFFEYGLNTFRERDEQMFKFISLSADMESVAARARTRMVFQQRIAQGRVYGNSRILGYTKKHGSLLIEPQEAEIVCLIFEMYVHRRAGLRRIAAELAERGCLRNDGTRIPARTIGSVLANPKYKGWYCGGKTAVFDSGKYRRTVLLDKSEWKLYPSDAIPAIVSEPLWNAAAILRKEKLAAYSRQVKMPLNTGSYPYSGMIEHEARPGIHYGHVNYTYKGIKRDAWQCRNYKDAKDTHTLGPTLYSDELDALVRLLLQEYVESFDRAADHLLQIYKGVALEGISQKRVQQLQARYRKLALKKKRLIELYEEDLIEKQEFREQGAVLAKDMTDTKSELKRIGQARNGGQLPAFPVEKIRSRILALAAEMPCSRELVRSVIRHIQVRPGSTRHKIRLEVELQLAAAAKPLEITRVKAGGLPEIQIRSAENVIY